MLKSVSMQVMQDLKCVFVYMQKDPIRVEFVDSTNGCSAAGLSRHTHRQINEGGCRLTVVWIIEKSVVSS